MRVNTDLNFQTHVNPHDPPDLWSIIAIELQPLMNLEFFLINFQV